MNTITPDEVKAIYETAQKNQTPGCDPRQSTRTLVHEQLQARNPLPFTSLTPEMQAQRDRRTPLTHAEKAAHYAHQVGQLSAEHHEAFGDARAKQAPVAVMVSDAHHYQQKLHGISLWEEADRLVSSAIGGGK